MKMRLVLGVLGVLAVIATLSICAVAGPEGDDSVLFKGNPYCVGLEACPAFAFWGPTATGYVELLEPDGKTVSDYIWVDFTGFLWFESDNENGGFAALPPPGTPFLGSLIEDGTLQEVDQFFPGGVTRPLFVQSSPLEGTTPEPSTLLLLGPAAVFLFNRARRFGRG